MATATSYSDMDPCPRVQVVFLEGDFDPAAVQVTILQISDVGEVTVRDAANRPAAGGVSVVDYEVPLGRVVTYRARQFDINGALIGLTDALEAQVQIDPSRVVVQDPLGPRRAVMVEAMGDFAAGVTRARPTSLIQTGRQTIALSRERQLVRGAPLTVSTRTAEEAQMLSDVLSENLVLIRTMPSIVRISGLFYCVIAEEAQRPVDLQYGGQWIEWPLVGDEVSRIELETIEPAITYQRYIDAFATYQDAIDAYSTYLDAITNPPPED